MKNVKSHKPASLRNLLTQHDHCLSLNWLCIFNPNSYTKQFYMARNREKHNLTHEIQTVLDSKLAIGDSKHSDKAVYKRNRDGSLFRDKDGKSVILTEDKTKDKIYSWETYRSYMKHCNYFAKYCKETHGCRTLEQCRPYVDEWLKTRANLSPYTQKLEASSLAKLYGCSTTDFVKTASRDRGAITRSRGEKVRDKHFSEENHKDLVEFCRSTGLRRAELKALTGDKLLKKGDKLYIIVNTASKGGKYREAPVIHNPELVERLMKDAGSGKVFPKVSGAADIHGYRGDYATEMYLMYARDIKDIPYDKKNKGSGLAYQSGVYHCRGDQKGVGLDKAAMHRVTEALGHNRIDVVAEHYIRKDQIG